MKVVFIQCPGFLRSSGRTNPYFDPIIKSAGDDWTIWLPTSEASKSGYPEDHVRYYSAIDFFSTWFWRIVHLLLPTMPSERVFYIFGKLVRPLIIGRWRDADLIITITGVFSDVLAGMFPQKRVVEIQHGVIYSTHNGYFDNKGCLSRQYRKYLSREFWVYGQGYADCFFKSPENRKWLDGRVKVIGDLVRAGESSILNSQSSTLNRNLVVFSLQLTDDLDAKEKAASVVAMEKFFGDFFAKYGNKYECYVKHHPRFNNCFDLSAFYQKFPQVKESKAPWSELYPKMALHVTFTSTVSFDCASAGVPTCLIYLPEAKIINCAYYRDDYSYPYHGKSAEEILAVPFEESSKIVHDWYRRFYTPFTEENCSKLLKGEL